MVRTSISVLFVSAALVLSSTGAAEASVLKSSTTSASIAVDDPGVQGALESLSRDFQNIDAAMVKDSRGVIVGIDTQQLQAAYGDSETVRRLDRLSNHPSSSSGVARGGRMSTSTLSAESFTNRVEKKMDIAFGVDIIKNAWSDEVRVALKSHAWKKASSIIFKNLERHFGKKVASMLIKRMANKLLPGGLPAQLALGVGERGLKSLWPW